MNASQDWEDIIVGDLGEIVAGGTPDRTNPSYWGGSIPWVTPSEITELKGKYIRDTQEKITEAGLAASAARLLTTGTVLVTTRATLGETAIAAVPLATNQGFKNVVPDKETDSLFAYYLLKMVKPEIIRLSSGTTFLEISKSDFARIKTRRPKIEEQRRITAVLDTLDETIAKTEAVIAKLRQVRAGMLYDLLTRGLNENGELRDPIAHPEDFNSLGPLTVPKAWRVLALEQVATLQRGFDLPIQDRREGTIPVIGSNGIDGYHDSGKIKGPGVITGRSGSIGFVYYTNSDFWPLNTTLYVRDFHGNQPMFVRLLLESLRLERFSAATGVPSLNRNFVHPTSVAIPLPEEQERIVFIIEKQNAYIDSEEAYLRKLRALRDGLMSDLLTGRVRVPEGLELPE